MSTVGIFRHNLFVPSETFIRAQAGALSRYRPTFIARRQPHHVPVGADAWSFSSSKDWVRDGTYGLTGKSSRLTGYLRENRFDLLHAHFGPDGLYASSSTHASGTPLIVTFHGRDVTVSTKQLLRSARPVSVNYALRRNQLGHRADVLLCVSNEIAAAARRLGFPSDRIRTHYIGVDTDTYTHNSVERPPVVVHVARLVEKKGTRYLLEAFAQVAKLIVDAKLVIIGDGPMRKNLEALSAHLGIASQVQFRGVLSPESVRTEVSNARVFALPSVTAANGDREGLPIALIEAMAVGTAVVATRHSGIPEAVSSDELGRLVEERDVSGLAGEIFQLLRDPLAAQETGSRAAAHVREFFDLRKQTAVLEGIYDTVK